MLDIKSAALPTKSAALPTKSAALPTKSAALHTKSAVTGYYIGYGRMRQKPAASFHLKTLVTLNMVKTSPIRNSEHNCAIYIHPFGIQPRPVECQTGWPIYLINTQGGRFN